MSRQVNGDIPPRLKKSAHEIILEFIRSRPPLNPVSSTRVALRSPWWSQSSAHLCGCLVRSRPVNWSPTLHVPGVSTSGCWRTSKLRGSSGRSHRTWSAEAAWVGQRQLDPPPHWPFYSDLHLQNLINRCMAVLGITTRKQGIKLKLCFLTSSLLYEPNPPPFSMKTINHDLMVLHHIHHGYSNSPLPTLICSFNQTCRSVWTGISPTAAGSLQLSARPALLKEPLWCLMSSSV